MLMEGRPWTHSSLYNNRGNRATDSWTQQVDPNVINPVSPVSNATFFINLFSVNLQRSTDPSITQGEIHWDRRSNHCLKDLCHCLMERCAWQSHMQVWRSCWVWRQHNYSATTGEVLIGFDLTTACFSLSKWLQFMSHLCKSAHKPSSLNDKLVYVISVILEISKCIIVILQKLSNDTFSS